MVAPDITFLVDYALMLWSTYVGIVLSTVWGLVTLLFVCIVIIISRWTGMDSTVKFRGCCSLVSAALDTFIYL